MKSRMEYILYDKNLFDRDKELTLEYKKQLLIFIRHLKD